MKKKVFRMVASTALISLMSLCMNGLAVSADINIGDFDEVESFRYIDSSDSQEDSSSDSQAAALPSKVDLRDRGVVTPVKSQLPFGTCWAFGSIAASETSILTEMGKTYEETQLDLSEKHLAWFVTQPLEDEYSSQNTEGVYWHNEISSSGKYNMGGRYFYASSLFSQGVGPVSESDYPYRGKNGLIAYCLKSGEVLDYSYSDKDDWTIDSSERFRRRYRLEDSIILGPALDEDKYYDDNEVVYDERILTAVKEQINEGRGVIVSYYADTSFPDAQGNYTYLNGKNWCQYSDTIEYANHEVCIVGYDDNYSKENFNETHRPPKDGAFLIKNSWGSGTNEFPNRASAEWGIEVDGVHTGYFWLSYYDMSIDGFESFDFDVTDHSDETEIIDQYDFSSYNGAHTVETNKDCEMANVFTAQYNQKLTAVSCITSNPNTQVYYEVYLLKDEDVDDTYGALVASEKEKYEYGGYHMKSLSKPVNLSKGQKYCIVVKLVNENNNNEVIVPYLTFNNDMSIGLKFNRYAKTIVNEGESLLKYDGKWYDWIEIRDTFNDRYDEIDADNFQIKGYSVLLDDTDISNRQAILSQDTFSYDGQPKKPEVIIDGLTYGKDYTVSYYNNVSAGRGRVEIEGTGLFTGKIVKYFSITDPTAAKNAGTVSSLATVITKVSGGKKCLTVSWKNREDVTGYQIQYSLKKSMKSAKTLKVKSADTTKRKIRKLKANRNYYVRIRTYKKFNGMTVYYAWSKAKKAKTK